MAKEKVDWTKAKIRYAKGTMSYADLAAELGVSPYRFQDKARELHFTDARKKYRDETAEKALQKSSSQAAERLSRVGDAAADLIDRTLAAIGDGDQFNKYLVPRKEVYAEPVESADGTLIRQAEWTEERKYSKMDTKALRDVTAALKDLAGVLRNIYGIPTQAEAEAQRIAAERLELEKAKASADAGTSGMVVELPPEMAEWSK